MNSLPGDLAEAEDEAERQLISTMEQDSDSLWRQQPVLAIATLAGPVLVTAAFLVSVGLTSGWQTVHRLVMAALVTFFVLGRFVILGGSDPESSTAKFSSAELAGMVFAMDMMAAIVISCHAGILFRIPWLGERLRFLMDTGQAVLRENRWMKRMTFASIVAFVMFPLASSGSIGGSLFGRLLGLTNGMTLLGVTVGSLLGCTTMYFGASLINRFVSPDDLLVRWGGISLIVVLIAILNRRYRKVSQPS